MEVPITFAGGQLDGRKAMTDGLGPHKVFIDREGRRVDLYTRMDELVYVYSVDMSAKLTARYDQTLEYFSHKDADSLRFVGESESEDADD